MLKRSLFIKKIIKNFLIILIENSPLTLTSLQSLFSVINRLARSLVSATLGPTRSSARSTDLTYIYIHE